MSGRLICGCCQKAVPCLELGEGADVIVVCSECKAALRRELDASCEGFKAPTKREPIVGYLPRRAA